MRKRSFVGKNGRQLLFKKRLGVGLLALLALVLMSGGAFAFTSQGAITMTGTARINMDLSPIDGLMAPLPGFPGLVDEPSADDNQYVETPSEEPSSDGGSVPDEAPATGGAPEEVPAADPGETSSGESYTAGGESSETEENSPAGEGY